MKNKFKPNVGEFRLIMSAKRARVIRKRGDYIKWNREFNGWLWKPL